MRGKVVIHMYVCVCVCVFFFRFFYIIHYYKILTKIPCAIQQVLVAYLFYI